MTTFAVTYVYDDRADVRDVHRPAHRAFLTGLHAAGVLRASGPVSDDGMQGALLVLDAPSAEAAGAILDSDPFATEGLVAARAVAEWTVVIGAVG
ncbi:YciI family protein [Sanguibacter sp. 25GB23B1]|uniref:YciI family protein n=1 Tax=unclassified Sanguibacter TaxID=2645534 RepID=UPI0032AF8617